ncbi:MAG: DapH/DapD/GlmU-related protein [Desulfovibrionaceae bacterium]
MIQQLLRIPGELLFHLLAAIPTKLGVLARRVLYRGLCARCGSCDIATGVEVHGFSNLEIGHDFSMNRQGGLYCRNGRIRIGDHCHFNSNVRIGADGGGEVRIGDGVDIGPNTVVDPSNHVFARTDVPIHKQGLRFGRIVIEDDVWIGANVVVVQGAHIGRGCVIGAGAVVRGEIPPGSVAVGVPARPVKRRDEAEDQPKP